MTTPRRRRRAPTLTTQVRLRLAALDELLAATHSLMDAQQAACDAAIRSLWSLTERVELLEEWTRLRFEQLQRER